MLGEHMESEIAEQPRRWRDLIGAGRTEIETAARRVRDAHPALLVFAARGSSDHAARYAQYLAQAWLGLPAMLATPSAYTALDARVRYPAAAAIAISQSGRSPDLLQTVDGLQKAGVPVVSVTNDATSELAALAGPHILLRAGAELSVAATKSYTTELVALFALISRVAERPWGQIRVDIERAARAAEALLEARPVDARLTEALMRSDRFLLAGRGLSMSSANEGALKLMETCAVAASGWSAADAKHGPLGQVQPGTAFVALTGSPGGRESVVALAADARAAGATLIEIGGQVREPEFRIALPLMGTVAPETIPLIEILPLQLMALALARSKGLDPDRPPALTKVTLTT